MGASNSVSERNNTTKEWLDAAIENDHINYFDTERIAIGRKLGSGSFGQVFQAKLTSGSQYSTIPVAVKILNNFEIEGPVDEKTLRKFVKELSFLRSVDFNPNISRFYGVSRADDQAYMLILEYADGGSLRDYLSINRALTGRKKLRFAKEIASGVACIHDRDIIHRDLNSVNILVHEGRIKIADLGISKKIADLGIAKNPTSSGSRLLGHLAYIDPQCFTDVKYVQSKKSDIYSLGVVFWELTSGRIPFSRLGNAAIAHIIHGLREGKVEGTPEAFVNLYTECWDQMPDNRPDIHEVCRIINELENVEDLEWASGETSLTDMDSIDSKSTQSITVVKTTELISEFRQIQLVPTEIKTGDELLKGTTKTLIDALDGGNGQSSLLPIIHDYVVANKQTPEALFNMLVDNNENGCENVINHPHCLLIGYCYFAGFGTEVNTNRAFEIFQALANDDDSYGQYFLGECYIREHRPGNNHKERAFEWFKKSAEKGNPTGQYELSNCYRFGWGTTKDIVEAKRWCISASERGNQLACTELISYNGDDN